MTAFTRLPNLVGCEDASIPQVLQARGRKTPDATFLLWGDDRWTYAEAWGEACRFAGFLRESGLVPGRDRVACYLSNRPEFLWAWLGSQVAGIVCATLHRSHVGSLLCDMLARSKATVLVTEHSALRELTLEGTSIRRVVVVDGGSPCDRLSIPCYKWPTALPLETDEVFAPAPTDVATVMFTSGTTGRSKAVLLPHNQYCRGGAAVAESMGITEADCFHAWVPLSHVGGQLDVTMAVIVAGARMVLIERYSASAFWNEVARYGATLFIGFTNVLEILLKSPPRADDAECGLRAGLIGRVPAELRDPVESRFGVVLHDIYGMSEAEPLALPFGSRRPPPGACGLANPDFELAIMDEEDRPLPRGSLGEIVARPLREGVMFAGYEDDEEATAAAWRGGWFHTGDIGTLDTEGFLSFKDRKKQMIRRWGESISSWELESIIAGHPKVDACAALGVPSPLGEEDVKVVVVPASGADLNPEDLVNFCRANMAKFMVPRYVEIVDELPLTNTGKVRKEDLKSTAPPVFDAESGLAKMR